MENPKVLQLTLTYNRHKLLERNVAAFLEQDYGGNHTLFIFNTGEPTELSEMALPANKQIILINNQLDYLTKQPYRSVGDKYRDAYTHFNIDEFDVVNHLDDDDFGFPNHISEGVSGYLRALEGGKLSYKPKLSWFLYKDSIFKAENVCEGSIFIDFKFMKSVQFPSISVKYHDCWVHPLQGNKMLVDPEGKSTWIYDWGNYSPTYKMSGRGVDDDLNYISSQVITKDKGDGLITPLQKKQLYKFYEEIENIRS